MEKDHGFTDRIIKDIHNVMQKNDLLAFEIVPVDANLQNKSPVLHIENWLGLESWCVKHVYMNCYSEIIDKYFPKPKRKALKVTSFNCENLTRLLNVTLLLNPEVNSFWNMRREMVMKSFLDKSFELTFSKLVLSRKPKSNDAFSYRRWILNLILGEHIDSRVIQNIANEELNICEIASDKTPNNYHSWNHRTWLVKELKNLETQFDLNFFYIKEYEFSERWAAKHISDYSCFHYRQFCIKNIFDINNSNWIMLGNMLSVNLRKNIIKILVTHFPKDNTDDIKENNLITFSDENFVKFLFSYMKNCKCVVNYALICRKLELLLHELLLCNDLIVYYKQHETLWYHRRFVVHELLQILYDYFGLVQQNGSLIKNTCRNCSLTDVTEKQSKMGRYDSNKIYSCILFNVLLSIERKFIKDTQSVDVFADKHEKYLNYVEGLKISL